MRDRCRFFIGTVLWIVLMQQEVCPAIAQPQFQNDPESVEVLQSQLRKHPQNGETYLKLGERLVEVQQIEAALNVYRASLPYTMPEEQDHAKKEAQVYTLLGDALMKLRRFPKALPVRQKVVELQPQEPEFREYLADALAMVGREEEAIASYLQASQLELNSGEEETPGKESIAKNNVDEEALAYESLGNVFLRYNKAEEAIVAYRKAIHLEPSYREFHTAIGNALVANRQMVEAESMNPEPSSLSKAARVQMAIGKALLEQQRGQEAIAAFEKAQQLAPQSREVQDQLEITKKMLSQQKQSSTLRKEWNNRRSHA
jgi:cytochrome c-type biogenesis protein CcmH/NrfG